MKIRLIEEKLINGNHLKTYELKNNNETIVEICNYGARITKILFYDIFSKQVDLLCGFNTSEEFVTNDNPYFNAVIGRVGNRISNSKFTLNKTEYNLFANNGKNSLHGGKEGFDKKFWNTSIQDGKLKLSYFSKDGEEGYPGNLQVDVYYLLTEDDELEIEYKYKSDKDTVVNLTNHAYFNLNGDFSYKVNNHFLKIDADTFSGVDSELIPNSIKEVTNTPFDFRKFKLIGKDINSDDTQIKYGNGYDHNFIFNNHSYNDCVCEVFSPITQIKIGVFTDCPCMQLYTGNGLDTNGKSQYINYGAFCLETQNVPNLINTENYEKAICYANQEYTTKTKYAFGLMKEDFKEEGKVLVEELIRYAKTNLYMEDLDEIYFRNLLLTQFKLKDPINYDIDFEEVDNLKVPDRLIKTIESYAVKYNLVEYGDANKFSNYIMGLLSPLPSKINRTFEEIKNINAKKATDYFYDLCIKNNYIQKTQIDKNLMWSFTDTGKKIEVTINLSKPEKSNKEIAKLAKEKVVDNVNYPMCPLCKENEGYYGSSKIQPRTNIRTISLKMGGEDWIMQYSPYGYFEEHCICINKTHTKMDVSPAILPKMFDFIDYLPNYFVGCNASLPYIGGSILNHEHFQGGKHLMPMFYCSIKEEIPQSKYPNVKVGILDWFNSTILIAGKDRDELIKCGSQIIDCWKNYENKKLHIINKSDGELHNSLSPILRINEDNEYELYFILRNNIQTKEYPEGYFHAHPEYHNIKKEGIGLIEAMGMFILPARLQNQLSLISSILCKEMEYDPQEISNPEHYLHVHKDMIEYLVNNFDPDNYIQAKKIVRGRVNVVCRNILLNTSVFKDDEKEFRDFVKKCLK
ncbi:MAG: galactose-1-epimerase [Clostridia bacterium]|nr:galactose-1-epimerase [Clostridia bacterium]